MRSSACPWTVIHDVAGNSHRKRLMRTPLVLLAGSILLAGCGPLPPVVYLPAPDAASTPAAEPPVAPMPPVGITIARADENRLLVSTNQPAYLAVFEIVPGRGASLVYPTSPRQQQSAMWGSNWLTLSMSSR